MSTSAIDLRKLGRGKLLRAAGAWLAVAVFAFAFDKIYALFAHGVQSAHMQFLFLYPLLCGALVYGLLALAAPETANKTRWRAGLNLYNAGLGTAAAGSLLWGIFEIAGTASPFTVGFFALGGAMMGVAVLVWALPARFEDRGK